MASYNESYDSILEQLLESTSNELPDFKNYVDTDPLVNLIKLIAAMSVSSNKYTDKYINSKFIQHPATIDTKSMYLLLEEFDLVPKRIVPGTITVIFEYVETSNSSIYATTAESTVLPDDTDSPKNVITEQLTIPQGTVFLVGDVEFTILDDYYIKAFNTYATITLIEGKFRSQRFYKSSIKHKRLQLDSHQVSVDYVEVIVDDEEFTKIDHAEYSNEDKVFTVEYDINGNYNIVFSDKTISELSDTSNIIVKYIESTGTSSYDAMADPIVIDSSVEYNDTDVRNNIIRNTVVGFTMSDLHHTESFNYEMIPQVLPTYRKAIVTDDYTNLTNFYPGVAIAKAYDINSLWHDHQELNIWSDYLTKVVVAPTTGYYITPQLRDNLYQYYADIGIEHSECDVEILNPVYIVLNLVLGVNVKTNNQAELLDLYSTISKAIEDYFAIGNIKYGSYISGDYIAALVAKLDERINYADVLEFSDKNGSYYAGYQLNAIELPLLGNLEILFNYQHIAVVDTIKIIDAIPEFPCEFLIQFKQRVSSAEIYDDKYTGFSPSLPVVDGIATWNIDHDLDSTDIFVSVLDADNFYKIIPGEIIIVDENNIQILFQVDDYTRLPESYYTVNIIKVDNPYNEDNPELTITSNKATWSINHNLNTTDVMIRITDTDNHQLFPDEFTIVDENNVQVVFNTNQVIPADTYHVLVGKNDICYSAKNRTIQNGRWLVNHELDSDIIVIEVIEVSTGNQIVPNEISLIDSNRIEIVFNTNQISANSYEVIIFG